MWIAMAFAPWGSFVASTPLGELSLSNRARDGSVGFIPVFETRDAAEQTGHKVFEIEAVEDGETNG